MSQLHPQEDPYLAELVALMDERGGVLRAEDIVERARPKDNPLHGAFEWSDKLAAHQYRLEQARTLVRKYEVVIHEQDVRIRRFVSVDLPDGRGYMDTPRALDDPWLRRQILDRMLAEAKSFAERYRRYSEAAGLVAAIEQWIDEVEGVLATNG